MQDNRDVLEKLQFSPNSCVLIVGAPDSYMELLSAKYPDLQVSTTVPEGSSQFDAVQIFVRNRMDVLELSPGAPAILKKHGLLWFSYPRETSGRETDINNQEGWEPLLMAGWASTLHVDLDDLWACLKFEYRHD